MEVDNSMYHGVCRVFFLQNNWKSVLQLLHVATKRGPSKATRERGNSSFLESRPIKNLPGGRELFVYNVMNKAIFAQLWG